MFELFAIYYLKLKATGVAICKLDSYGKHFPISLTAILKSIFFIFGNLSTIPIRKNKETNKNELDSQGLKFNSIFGMNY